MTVGAAMQSAAVRLIGRRPQVFFGATGKFEIEITDLVNEVATDITQYRDWQALTVLESVTGDGVTTDFALPDDYAGMLQNADVQDLDSWFWRFRHVPDINEFLYLEQSGFTAWPGVWIIYGDLLRFAPAPATGQQATYPYVSKNYALSGVGAPKEAFDADDDTFRLPERLLTLGLVWRWRENKKLDASGDQEAFIKALDEYAVKDAGSNIMRWSSRRGLPGTRLAWPWALGVTP